MRTDPLTAELKEHALSHGIDLIGITSAKPFVRRGRELEIIDPKELLADAQAVIVTAFHMNEVIGTLSMDKDHPRGRFSQYSVRAYTPLENYHIQTVKGFLEKRGYKAIPNKSEEPRSKLRGILTDDFYPQGTSQNGGCRSHNPVAPFGRLFEIKPNGSISGRQALACIGFPGFFP